MCDLILLTSEANIQYVTGFHTTARRPKQIGYNAVILSGKEKYFVVPEKWKVQVEESISMEGILLVTYPNVVSSYYEKLSEILGSAGHKVIGIEYGCLELNAYLFLKKEFSDVEFVDITKEMDKKRLVKKPDEIMVLRRAADVAVQAMEYAKDFIRPGISELRCAAELEYCMRKQGSEGVPFTMKVLSGKNSVVVTQVPGEKPIGAGEFVLLDFGAIVKGYCSDWTRTYSVCSESREMGILHETVFKMEREIISHIRPGVPLAHLVELENELAAKSPYGKYHNPHLGHSIGIMCHEWPVLEPGVEGELKENMVITIEPGIYVPGIGGVRIEDEVLVTKDGHEILTGLSDENHVIAVTVS